MKKWIVLLLFVAAGLYFLALDRAAEGRIQNAPDKSFPELKPQSFRAVAFGESSKISDLAPAAPGRGTSGKRTADEKAREIPNRQPFRKQISNAAHDRDAAVADMSDSPAIPAPSLSFDGISSEDDAAAYGGRFIPPDPNGDVGPNHYVQAVNALTRIYDKQGIALTPPFKLSDVFAPLGTVCSSRNDGDPIVLYDALADRWLLSQFCTFAPPFRQLIAVSKTGDPTGAYYLYEFVMPNFKLNDYPKIGVWSDGYYMTTDEFVGGDYAGSGVFAFDRSKILRGDATAGFVYFDLASPTTVRIGGLLPADLDGLRPPPPNAPGIFAGYTATEYGDAADALRLFNFRADFQNPANSTFTEQPNSPLPVPAFDPTSPEGREDIQQPAPGDFLDSQSDRLMYRLAYRNFGASESLVVNQTVRLTPISEIYRAGVRFYELRRNTGGNFAVKTAETAGDTTASRWMGSAAQDYQGNLAVGYSFASEEKPPAILYTGKPANQTTNALGEGSLIFGTGVQTAFAFRWGDYTAMNVDATDDCTFWLTNEYYTLESQQQSPFSWLTRIGKFKFDGCVAAPRATIKGGVTNAATGQPITGAVITANQVYLRQTDATGNYPNLLVLPGTYSVIASAPGFRSQTVTVTVADGQTFVQNFALQPTAVIVNPQINLTAESCPINGAIDPNETVTVEVTLQNTGAVNTQNLIVTLLPTGGVTNPSPSQNFGVLTGSGQGATRTFTFTAASNLICGGTLTLTFQLQNGAENLGTTTAVLTAGAQRIAFQENFDAVAAPALPSGWTTAATGGQQNWTTSTTRKQSAPNSVFSPDPFLIGLNELVSPVFYINSAAAELSFRNWYELETTFLRNRLYDGSVLEIKIGAADWADIEAAGGVFLSGGYDGVIDSCCQNPLAGRRGWSGKSGVNQTPEFITSRVRLPQAAAGNNVRLRWRVGTDVGTFKEGQYIDDIVVTDGYNCDCATTANRAPFDFDGDGKSDLSVFRPSDAANDADFYVANSGNNQLQSVAWGSVGDRAVNADYDGDGRADYAVFRPSSHVWFVLQSQSNTILPVTFGFADDRQTPADFDGDGKADIAVFRPSNGTWYIRRSANNQILTVPFGTNEGIPATADFDGDGKADIAVFRPSNGTWYWINSANGSVGNFRFGQAGDRPVTGDFDGDGKSDFVVYRPSENVWYLRNTTDGFHAVKFGQSGDQLLQADFDGDGKRDIGVFRPSSGVWYWINSANQAMQSRNFGANSDVAVPSIFVY